MNPAFQKRIFWFRFFLYSVAACQFSAIVALFFPDAWMDSIARIMGLAPMSGSPLEGYLARQACALYCFHAATVAIIARGLPRSLELTWPLGCVTIVFGLVMLGIDLAEEMPRLWTMVEAPMIIGGGAIILLLNRWCRKISTHSGTNTP